MGLRRGARGPLNQREASLLPSADYSGVYLHLFNNDVDVNDDVCVYCHDVFDVAAFEGWLLAHGLSRKHVRTLVRYVQRYLGCFLAGRLAEISAVAGRKHIMMGFSWLSTYLGCYDKWLEMRRKAGLKWRERNSVDVFNRVFSNELDGLEEWLREVFMVGDDVLKRFVYFLAVSGLRVDEALMCLNRIRACGLNGYFDENLGCLCHARFKEFLRGNKAAFITVVTENMKRFLDEWAVHGKKLSYCMIVKRLRKRNLPLRLHHLRKFFATKLVENGIAMPLVNLLQGRSDSGNVLMVHYFRPELKTELEHVKRVIAEKIEAEFFMAETGLYGNAVSRLLKNE